MLLRDVGNSVDVLVVEKTMNMASVRKAYNQSAATVERHRGIGQHSGDVKY